VADSAAGSVQPKVVVFNHPTRLFFAFFFWIVADADLREPVA